MKTFPGLPTPEGRALAVLREPLRRLPLPASTFVTGLFGPDGPQSSQGEPQGTGKAPGAVEEGYPPTAAAVAPLQSKRAPESCCLCVAMLRSQAPQAAVHSAALAPPAFWPFLGLRH